MCQETETKYHHRDVIPAKTGINIVEYQLHAVSANYPIDSSAADLFIDSSQAASRYILIVCRSFVDEKQFRHRPCHWEPRPSDHLLHLDVSYSHHRSSGEYRDH